MKNIDWKKTIYTDGSSIYTKHSKNIFHVKLRVCKNNNIETIFLRISPDGEQELIKMKEKEEDNFFKYYTGRFEVKKNINNYRFLIFTSDDIYWFSQQGLSRTMPPDQMDFKFIRDFKTPEWLEGSIFYQIFPDRFHDGNPLTNVRNGEYSYEGKTTKAYPWGTLPRSYETGGHMDFYGGDLAGIEQKIPYFKKLGINALYLNPIFLSPSNHKYDTQDYKKIDPHFGTNEEFADLVTKLHNNGIKIILDGVFNHCGIAHYWFNKSGFYKKNEGAYKNPESPYSEYFTFYDNPDDYHAWKGVKTLPKLNYKSEALRKAIYKSKDSIMNFWTSPPYDIDGWRLDVANMLARQDEYQGYEEVYREMRHSLKNNKVNSYLMGEHFFDATNLLRGDMLDSVMNYQGFLFPVLKWITKKERFGKEFKKIKFTSEDLSENLKLFYSMIPFNINLLMFNLLDCHDLPRFYSLVNEDFSLLKMGTVLLFTYPGIPCIYNGDETGMTGLKENEVRKCMEWDEEKWNKDIFELYKNLIKLRKTSTALKQGGFKLLNETDEVFCYVRFFKKESIFIVLNNNPKEVNFEIPSWHIGEMEGDYREFFTGEVYKADKGFIKIKIKPYGSIILGDNNYNIYSESLKHFTYL